MTTRITEEEFKILVAANRVEIEKDVQFSYENVIDENGNEVAFAVYSSGNAPEYHKRDED